MNDGQAEHRPDSTKGLLGTSVVFGVGLLLGAIIGMWLKSGGPPPQSGAAICPCEGTAIGETATDTPTPLRATAISPNQPTSESTGEPIQIRWYVGLGTGGNAEQIEVQEAVVREFNETHPNIELVLEMTGGNLATDDISTAIAAGNPPDILGPLGDRAIRMFQPHLLDLRPLISEAGYSLDEFDFSLVEHYYLGANGEMLGIPYAVFPSALWYSRDVFDEAGLAYPPHEYGAPYFTVDGQEMPWDIKTLEMLARALTVDVNGNTPNNAGFDAENIEQFGFDMPWTTAAGQATFFGAGRIEDGAGHVQIPSQWREFWQWYYRGVWEDHFIPNATYANSDMLNQGNTFSSGRVAMTPQHLWYRCCAGDEVSWDVAAMPAYNGTVTAKIHMDTFAITNQSKHPREAFEVLIYLIEREDLLQTYGAFPARSSQQAAFLDEYFRESPAVNQQIFLQGVNYIDLPGHEVGHLSDQEVDQRMSEFQALLQSTPGLDIEAEIARLESDLQGILDSLNE